MAFALAGMAFAQQVSAEADDPLAALLRQDVRLATVAERMLGANAALCRETMPLSGIILHSKDQYRADIAGDSFANGAIAVAATVPGSAAAATLARGDGIAAIGTVRASTLHAEGKSPLRDSAFAVLAAQPAPGVLALTIAHGGVESSVPLQVKAGCRALVEIRADSGLGARSDGRVIQVNYGLASAASDDELAVVFAHELGHLVLEHRRRLEAAGVEKGFFGEFGRNRRLNRAVEVEADRISVHLLANAGYDPAIAPAFWRTSLGRRSGGGLFRSAIYPSPEARAQLIEREVAEHLAARPRPSWPAHLLALRDTPFE
jgi:hypothetical protein